MILLTPLTLSGTTIRERCTPGVTEHERRQRIIDDSAALTAEEDRFRAAAAAGVARTFTASAYAPAVKDDMLWYYKRRLTGSVEGRKIMQDILTISAGQCAFCHIARATTLDHSFPKARHPRLAVDPHNLVPACRDCNLGRNVGRGTVSISPYFDHWVEDITWLTARIDDPTRPEIVTFSLVRDASLQDDQWAALNEFFDETDLGGRYSLCAVQQFFPLATELRNVYGSPPRDQVRRTLHDRYTAHSGALGPNRWQTAAYDAWLTAVEDIDWDRAGTIPAPH